MNCKFINVLVFAAGAVIGSAVTYKVVKTKYERIAQEEIESVKDAFGNRLNKCADILDDIKKNADANADNAQEAETMQGQQTTHIDWSEYEDLDEDEEEEADREEYARLANNYTSEKGGAKKMSNEPYVISPYDFGEVDDYKQFELTYYADGTIEDTEYNIVTDVEELIGPKALFTFGEYEEDSVFVRNDQLRADFQILKDYRTYEEARSTSPKRVDNE